MLKSEYTQAAGEAKAKPKLDAAHGDFQAPRILSPTWRVSTRGHVEVKASGQRIFRRRLSQKYRNYLKEWGG